MRTHLLAAVLQLQVLRKHNPHTLNASQITPLSMLTLQQQHPLLTFQLQLQLLPLLLHQRCNRHHHHA
jgi:hypothetical protein